MVDRLRRAFSFGASRLSSRWQRKRAEVLRGTDGDGDLDSPVAEVAPSLPRQESSDSASPTPPRPPEPSRPPPPLPSSAATLATHPNIGESVPSEWLLDLELVRSGAAMFPVTYALLLLADRFDLCGAVFGSLPNVCSRKAPRELTGISKIDRIGSVRNTNIQRAINDRYLQAIFEFPIGFVTS